MSLISISNTSLRPLTKPLGEIRPWPLFLSHVRKYWPTYAVGMIAVLGTNIAEIFVPKMIQWVIDLLKDDRIPFLFEGLEKKDSYILLVALFLIVLIFQGIFRAVWRLTLGQESHRSAASLKAALWDRSRYFPRHLLDSVYNPGMLMNAATSDIGIARFIFGFTLIGTVDFIFLGSLTIGSMIIINPYLSLMSLSILFFLPLAMYLLAKLEYRYHRDAQDALGDLNDLSTLAVSTVKLQRLTQTSVFWEKKLEMFSDIYREKRLKVIITSVKFVLLMGAIPILSYVVLFYLGLPRVFAGTLRIGEFVALQSYLLLFQGPLGELGYIISEWQQCFASLDRLCDIYRQPDDPIYEQGETKSDRLGPKTAKNPVFRAVDLGYHYHDVKRKVLSDLSFSIEAGEHLGIIGPIGSGKSTLVDILSGFKRDFSGILLLGGRDIREYSHEGLRKTIALAPQKPFLFANTIRYNLLLSRDLPEERLWEVLNLVELTDEIEKFPKKLDTPLGEWGINLSGGQKQRLTIARALVVRPEILILDDCLSAVDTATESQVLDRLKEELPDTTTIWVAHRSSTLRLCERIIELHGYR